MSMSLVSVSSLQFPIPNACKVKVTVVPSSPAPGVYVGVSVV